MDEARYAEIGEAFQKAVDLETQARAVFLKDLRNRDEDLAREVESLLAHDETLSGADAFDEGRLGWQASDLPVLKATKSEEPARLPERIGPYFVTGILGQGGMGRVYRCRQVAPIQREVAVKVIRAGMITPPFLRRFQLEREALARMDHPGIARVFDAGTTREGQPYFVMEYFPGEPVAAYCDRAGLRLNQRLELFVRIARAVHHAHQRGVLHRDLKPSNLLVAEVDGEIQIKVIDFGLARAVEGPGPDEEHATLPGQVLGTPAYMSPEQAGNPELIDVRTDVYALGVVLYEMLTGSLPFESRAATPQAALREAAEEREARRASSRFSRVTPENERSAKRRSSGVRQMYRVLRGELDWILHKALESQQNRRYPSALHMAEDVRAYLSGEPVTAAPPGALYLLGKFARRHRGLVAGLVVAFVSLSVGLAIAIHQAREARRSETETRAMLNEVHDHNDVLRHMLISADPREVGKDARVTDLLQRGRDYLDDVYPNSPRVRSEALYSIGSTYRELGLWKDAEVCLREAVEQRRILDDGNLARMAYDLNGLAILLNRMGRVREAEVTYREAIATYDRIPEPEGLVRRAAWQANLGGVLLRLERWDEAEHELRESLEVHEAQDPPHAIGIGILNLRLGQVLAHRQEVEAAAEAFERAQTVLAEVLPEGHPYRLRAAVAQGLGWISFGRYAEAEEILRGALRQGRETFPEGSAELLRFLDALSHCLLEGGRELSSIEEDLRSLLDEARAIVAQNSEPDSLVTMEVEALWGQFLLRKGERQEAAAVLERALPILRGQLGEEHSKVLEVAADWERSRAQ